MILGDVIYLVSTLLAVCGSCIWVNASTNFEQFGLAKLNHRFFEAYRDVIVKLPQDVTSSMQTTRVYLLHKVW